MTITEESRYQLYKKLETALGSDEANTLMEHLPPVGWADVATRTDLEHLHVLLKADLALLQAEMRTEFTQMRTDTTAERAEVRTDIRLFEERLDARFESTELRMERSLSDALHRQLVQVIASTAAMVTVTSTLVVIAGQMLGH